MRDVAHEPAIERLAWCLVHRRAVERRLHRDPDSVQAREADRESQAEHAAALADVYRCFGPDEEAITEAARFADLIDDVTGLLFGRGVAS